MKYIHFLSNEPQQWQWINLKVGNSRSMNPLDASPGIRLCQLAACYSEGPEQDHVECFGDPPHKMKKSIMRCALNMFCNVNWKLTKEKFQLNQWSPKVFHCKMTCKKWMKYSFVVTYWSWIPFPQVSAGHTGSRCCRLSSLSWTHVSWPLRGGGTSSDISPLCWIFLHSPEKHTVKKK